MRISDWSSDVCSSDLLARLRGFLPREYRVLRLRGCRPGIVVRGRFSEDEGNIIVHAAVEIACRAAVDEHETVGGKFEHVAVVADDQHRAVEAVQRLHQRLARVDVEVVGRSEEHTSELQSLMRLSYD